MIDQAGLKFELGGHCASAPLTWVLLIAGAI
jgi:hypothetical protein